MIASGVLYTSFQNLAIAIPMERDDGTLKRHPGHADAEGRRTSSARSASSSSPTSRR